MTRRPKRPKPRINTKFDFCPICDGKLRKIYDDRKISYVCMTCDFSEKYTS